MVKLKPNYKTGKRGTKTKTVRLTDVDIEKLEYAVSELKRTGTKLTLDNITKALKQKYGSALSRTKIGVFKKNYLGTKTGKEAEL